MAALAAGMVLFALCWHHGMPWSAFAGVGLAMAGTAIAWEEQRAEGNGQTFGVSQLQLVGLDRFSTSTIVFSVAGAGVGIAFGLWQRRALGMALQPSVGVQPFVIVACLIGATEELVYRGWLLGHSRAFGWPAAIVIAAVAHAAYKTALFAWPAAPAAIDLSSMMLFTAVGGLVAGLLRMWSGSLVPAIVAHVAFDFVVYRAVAEAPWWVWG
jgi:membrane protease YdiL (CAAX protease family)